MPPTQAAEYKRMGLPRAVKLITSGPSFSTSYAICIEPPPSSVMIVEPREPAHRVMDGTLPKPRERPHDQSSIPSTGLGEAEPTHCLGDVQRALF